MGWEATQTTRRGGFLADDRSIEREMSGVDYVLLACKHWVFIRQADSFGLPRMLTPALARLLGPLEPLPKALS